MDSQPVFYNSSHVLPLLLFSLRPFAAVWQLGLNHPIHRWNRASESRPALTEATVFLKGTYTGSSTNEEGQFQLKADFSKGQQVLAVSFTGYETLELA